MNGMDSKKPNVRYAGPVAMNSSGTRIVIGAPYMVKDHPTMLKKDMCVFMIGMVLLGQK